MNGINVMTVTASATLLLVASLLAPHAVAFFVNGPITVWRRQTTYIRPLMLRTREKDTTRTPPLPYPRRTKVDGAPALSSALFPPENDTSGGDGGGDDWKGFNPFDVAASARKGRSSTASTTPPPPGGAIYPRQLRMRDLTSDLLRVVSDPDETERLLSSHRDFLLEQLENVDAVLEPDSIYHPSMGRAERYQRYREVMEKRTKGAKNGTVRAALEALSDFVLRHE